MKKGPASCYPGHCKDPCQGCGRWPGEEGGASWAVIEVNISSWPCHCHRSGHLCLSPKIKSLTGPLWNKLKGFYSVPTTAWRLVAVAIYPQGSWHHQTKPTFTHNKYNHHFPNKNAKAQSTKHNKFTWAIHYVKSRSLPGKSRQSHGPQSSKSVVPQRLLKSTKPCLLIIILHLLLYSRRRTRVMGLHLQPQLRNFIKRNSKILDRLS